MMGRGMLRRALTTLALLLVAGCARRGKKPEPVVPPPPVADAAPVGDAIASAPDAGPVPTTSEDDEPPITVPAFPIPSAPKNAPAEPLAIASAICAAAYRPAGNGIAVGCRSHPPFKTPAQMPDGKLVRAKPDSLGFCEIRRVFRGSFSRAGASQAVVVFGECWDDGESFSSNAMNSASVVLVEEVPSPSRWKVKAYERNVHAEACETSRTADGHDVLLCHATLGAFSMGAMTFLFAIDFARTDPRTYTVARIFADDVDCTQVKGMPDSLSTGFTKTRVTRTALADVNQDGTPDLVVDVERAHLSPSPALKRGAEAECAKGAYQPHLERLLPKPETKRLELVSERGTFVPSPSSQKLLDAWEAESPGFGLESAGPPKL